MTSATRYPAEVSLTLAFNGKITLLTLFVLPVLISLGYWQLQRADEKRLLQKAFEEQQQQPPLELHGLALHQLNGLPNYSRVTVDGHFDNRYIWLLDNKIRQGRVGYEVVIPFVIDKGPTILINRGWIQAGSRRTDLPSITTIEGPVTLFASTYRPWENTLLESQPENNRWPRVTVQLDHQRVEKTLQRMVPDIRLRLDETSQAAFVTGWQTINISPEKHTGYAVQWFTMAVAILLWFICTNTNAIGLIKAKISNKIPDLGE